MAEITRQAKRECAERELRMRRRVYPRWVEAFAFREAAAVLRARLREIDKTRQTHLERVFLDWRDLPEEERPDFLTYAHRRRAPALSES